MGYDNIRCEKVAAFLCLCRGVLLPVFLRCFSTVCPPGPATALSPRVTGTTAPCYYMGEDAQKRDEDMKNIGRVLSV